MWFQLLHKKETCESCIFLLLGICLSCIVLHLPFFLLIFNILMLILFCYFVDEIWECGRCRQFWTGRDADGEMAVWCRSCWCRKSSNQLRVRLGIDCTCRVKQQWNDTKNVIRKIKWMSAIPVKKHLMKNQQLKKWKTEQKKTTTATKCQLLIFFIFSNQISFYRRWKLICEKNFFIFF